MLKKIVEFIHSFKVKPVASAEAPYKLEPPEKISINEMPVTVEVKESETKVETPTIQFPKTTADEQVEKKVVKKSTTSKKPKAVAAKTKNTDDTKAVPAMKVVKAKTPRKSKKSDLE